MSVVHVTATIANGASLSDAILINEAAVVGIKMPAAWTAADLTLQAAGEDAESTFNNVYDQEETEVTIQADASRHIVLEPAKFIGIKWLKIRSGTAASAVNQGGARSIVVYLMTE